MVTADHKFFLPFYSSLLHDLESRRSNDNRFKYSMKTIPFSINVPMNKASVCLKNPLGENRFTEVNTCFERFVARPSTLGKTQYRTKRGATKDHTFIDWFSSPLFLLPSQTAEPV